MQVNKIQTYSFRPQTSFGSQKPEPNQTSLGDWTETKDLLGYSVHTARAYYPNLTFPGQPKRKVQLDCYEEAVDYAQSKIDEFNRQPGKPNSEKRFEYTPGRPEGILRYGENGKVRSYTKFIDAPGKPQMQVYVKCDVKGNVKTIKFGKTTLISPECRILEVYDDKFKIINTNTKECFEVPRQKFEDAD